MGITYRPEIDGLRAIAVLAVVLFHAGIGGAGYVGVDVFFVISGYLITSLLLTEHAKTGRIDLLAFYARRVRRIFPAAAVVILAVLSFSWLLPETDAPQEAAKSAGAALLFAANAFFEFTTGGYWDSASNEMPLLHLWSLSVEEQFYFLWPALLIFTRSRKVFAGLALASFVLAEYWMATNPEAAFFRMPARFWELAAGGLIAAAPSLRLSPVMGLCGVLLTLVACYTELPHFPASGALPSVLGAALVIAYVHGGGTNRFLASKPMVAVGLVSYSLYLWHWPLLAFYRANGGESVGVKLALCALALILAALSYRFVERPFRRMRFPSGRTVLAGSAASVVLALSACAYSLHEPARAKLTPAQTVWRDHPSRKCEYHPGDKVPKCLPPIGATVTFWGDSMALAWSAGVPGSVVYSFPGCIPVFGWDGKKKGCSAFNAQVPQNIRGDTLYIVARWGLYKHLVNNLTPTLESVRGVKRVVLIGPNPTMQAPIWLCASGKKQCGQTLAQFERVSGPILAALRKQAKPFPNVEVWDVSDQFCTTKCLANIGGVYLYYDTHHPSATQAKLVFSRLRPASTVAAGSGR